MFLFSVSIRNAMPRRYAIRDAIAAGIWTFFQIGSLHISSTFQYEGLRSRFGYLTRLFCRSLEILADHQPRLRISRNDDCKIQLLFKRLFCREQIPQIRKVSPFVLCFVPRKLASKCAFNQSENEKHCQFRTLLLDRQESVRYI